MTLLPSSDAARQGKTKAKLRYLRRKKDRRKAKLKATASTSLPQHENEDEWEGTEHETDYGPAAAASQSFVVAGPPTPPPDQKRKRQKKRRRVVDELEITQDEESVPLEETADTEMNVDVQVPQQERAPKETPVVLEEVLPSFPLPVVPDAPSKSLLAMQGLDQALVDAEIVDPDALLPVLDGSEDGGTMLGEKMRKRLKDLGITELFAVQTRLLPFLLPKNPLQRALYQPYNPPRDVCVSAPTGSGKTLAYVLPIIEILSTRIVIRLRALIVLPTRDLVMQVRETFEALGKGRGLQIGTVTGQQSFAHQQSQLVADKTSPLIGGTSKVDILICTPGRLIDHLQGTPNFTLQHLRFLVIDEADRLLAQSYQDWLAKVLTAVQSPPTVNSLAEEPLELSPFIHDAVAPQLVNALPYPGFSSFPLEEKQSACQKLLFSATLTQDPGKIAALKLRNPKYFVIQSNNEKEKESGVLDLVMERFSIPSTLREHMIICSTSQKPLILFYLVHMLGVTNTLVFTKSTESTMRLVRLLEYLEKEHAANSAASTQGIVVRAYSSDLPAGERKLILGKFKSQEIQILVCSDLIARGIDISHVSHVVSYDVPIDMRKYVHRVGRTARAGRTGDAWTLVEEQEARYFKLMLREADHLEKVKRLRIGEKELAPLIRYYEVALGQLKDVYSR